MTTSQTMADMMERDPALPTNHEHRGTSRYRAVLGGFLLALAVAAALAAGGWGVISSLVNGAPPARIGETVEAPDGLFRVESVTPEHMAPMQAGKFTTSGMSMSSMGMDMAPKGYRRFTADVSLAAENGSVSYSSDDFRASAEGFKATGPIRAKLPAGTLAQGETVTGSLVFQVPEKAKSLVVSFDGSRPVSLDLPAGKNGGHSHGGSHEDHDK